MSQPKVKDDQPIQPATAEDHSGTERLKALADGLFGVVMTLLVLDLKLDQSVSDAGLLDVLAKEGNTIFI